MVTFSPNPERYLNKTLRVVNGCKEIVQFIYQQF